MIKKMSQTSQRMTDLKNYKLVYKLDLHPEAHQPKVKKSIVVIEDSLIKNVNGRDVSPGDSVKIRPHPGASTEDLTDHIKPAMRKNPDIVVIQLVQMIYKKIATL